MIEPLVPLLPSWIEISMLVGLKASEKASCGPSAAGPKSCLSFRPRRTIPPPDSTPPVSLRSSPMTTLSGEPEAVRVDLPYYTSTPTTPGFLQKTLLFLERRFDRMLVILCHFPRL